MRRLFVDTTVPTFALGGEHALQLPCRAMLTGAAADKMELHASVDAVQEFLFHRLRRGDRGAAVLRRLPCALDEVPGLPRIDPADLDIDQS